MSRPQMTFEILRAANIARLPTFRDKKGRLAHPPKEGVPPGHDWALSQWSNATCGELGEAADLIKKIERGDFELDEVVTIKGETATAREFLAKEIADVICYADLLANRAGVDVGEAVRAKFNEISQRVASPIFIRSSGANYHVVDESYKRGPDTQLGFHTGEQNK